MYSQNPSGVGIYTREILNQLQQNFNNKDIEMVYYSYTAVGLKGNNKIIKVKLPFPFEYIFKWFLPLHRFIWNIFYLPILAKKFDLVYSLSSHGSPFIKKQIITIHDLICFHFPKQHTFQFCYFKFILPSIIKTSKKIIAISNFTKNEVIKYYNTEQKKIYVVHNGGNDFNTLQNSLRESEKKLFKTFSITKPFFLTVGASYPHKNTHLLIQAMQKLPEYELIVTGSDNRYMQHLRKYIQNEKMNNIVFTGYITDSQLQTLYSKCCANVYLGMYEGFGFPPMEAGLHNKISIVSPSEALEEIYENAVVYVDSLHIKDITESLKKVVSPQFDKTSYIIALGKVLQQYTWNNAANKIYEIITDDFEEK